MKLVILTTVLSLLLSLSLEVEMQDIKLKTVDIKPEQMKINKISGGAGGAGGGIADQLQELIIKIQFREKYMKKKGIE